LEDGGGAGKNAGGVSGSASNGGSKAQQAGSDSVAEGGMPEPSQSGSSAGGSETGGKSGSGGSSAGKGGSGGSEVADSAGAGGVPTDGGAGGDSGNNGGTGAVGELVNPSFETANTLGWTVEPSEALTKRHAFVQLPQGTATVPDGGYEFSTWHMTDTFTVELFQTVTGLEDGTYTFQGYFSRGDGFNSVALFARNCGGDDPEPVVVPLTDPAQWLNVELTGIEVTGGSCEVGLSIDSNPTNWLNADDFTLVKEP
ncbi:MAG TPA: hypothetical protein VEQ59_04080, partial [Polyangiaceae bacterium]|nr:hypothetical protein [Polyangiaceae bacterium]